MFTNSVGIKEPQRTIIWYFWSNEQISRFCPSLAAVFQLLITIKLFSSQSRGQKKDKSASLFEREAICIKMLGTYVFAVTSTNCPGRKWAAYNGVPAKEEDRPRLNKCQNPQITLQSLPCRVDCSHRKESNFCFLYKCYLFFFIDLND